MDFITHALIGAGVARLASPKRKWIPQLSLAGILGSELQDADSWLYLIHPYLYGKYHRVASHNLWGLAIVGLVAAGLAWLITRVRPWRRFGWFVADNLPREESPLPHVPWRWFALVALIAAYLHFAADAITGFGNIEPFWPWSSWDISLHAVTSFDLPIFASTLAWHFSLRGLHLSRKGEVGITVVYVVCVVVYVLARLHWGQPTAW